MKIIFDVQHLYYLPQYLPVLFELRRRQLDAQFVFYRSGVDATIGSRVIKDEQLDVHWVDDAEQALAHYRQVAPDWLILGNQFKEANQLAAVTKTALMQHGIGPKSCYYTVSETPTTLRFVEGQHRKERLEQMYPKGRFIDTGYAKLDPIFNGETPRSPECFAALDPNKPTLLYAPTFYPSSLESLPKDFPAQFSQYNILIKPHFFSLVKPAYQAQRDRLAAWAAYPNVQVASIYDYNLLPFLQRADLMISDASSAIFEFAVLGKPVVWCNFYKLRWTYRFLFKFRLKKRLDPDIEQFRQFAFEVQHARHLKAAVQHQLQQTSNSPQAQQVLLEMTGKLDGLCSQRIVDSLLQYSVSER